MALRKILTPIFTRLPLLTFFIVVPALANTTPTPPEVAAKAWVLMSYESGQVLAGENIDTPHAPASLVKIMTSYVVGKELEAGHITAEDTVIISENAWGKKFPGSSKMFLNVGDEVSVDDLHRGVIISSGNDATVALAEHVAGHQPAFVEMMNKQAEKLGMTNSYFSNPHGLDSTDQMITAYDMALLTRALIQDLPSLYPMFKEKSFTFGNIKQGNRNALLWDTTINVDGVKTGYTKQAGYSLVSSAEQHGQRLIAVVLGTNSTQTRRTESKKLLTWGFRFYQDIQPQFSGKELAPLKVWYGSPSTINVEVADGGVITVPRRQRKNIEHRIMYDHDLEAPVEQGQQVGKVEWYLNDDIIAERALIAKESAEKAPWYQSMVDVVWRPINQWFTDQDWDPREKESVDTTAQ
ncbi:D-alanyl-D-alanine carboxypeptidase family protein [Photobacterium aphoticum]|uniref:serine-type D-Ala-D-Ala carboxypeptidase n=1 Tax=Photobacterium aphoticum TaxID=754436 RepID=A0A0J1GQP7_9GAMM|nr:D-alanyl-D-alanine carboxypeptidase family protein [Photobacterium aphoticum]KLV02103.1 D-alanyl-D-alanine carboxypeptidase [Photobacterium aphoticum]PSU60358.1 D-alanyl-D-alanine carboxypeptidase [Photobacterium aphoticum]GHA35200.1 D-alanyl-D-alanine carboxypeptidase [Photobacterium aphoticum]